MNNLKKLLLTTALLSTPTALVAEEVTAEIDKGYFKFKSSDGNFKWKFDGRIMLDAKSISKYDGENLISTNADLRRARLAIKTEFYKDWAGEFDIDFKNNKTKVKDMWVSYKPFENAEIKVGNHKPFFSIAEVTTSRWYPLMETASIADFSAPGRRVGVSFSYWQPRYFAGVSVYGEETSMNDEKDDLEDTFMMDTLLSWAEDHDPSDPTSPSFEDYLDDEIADKGDPEVWATASERTGYSARALYRPIINESATRFFHIGGSVQRTSPFAADLDYVKVKGEVHDIAFIYQKLKPWKDLHVDNINASSIELAARFDKFYFQSEFISNDFSFIGNGYNDYTVDGYYAEVSYFIKGPGRPYNLSDGEFGPVVPKDGSQFEVIVRYDTMDANDSLAGEAGDDIMGGELTNLTIGLNWYVNPNVVLRLNHSRVETDDEAKIDNADVNITAARVEFLF